MASPIPNAMTQFIDNRGNPLSNGLVNYFQPGTTTPKTTWRDAAQTVINSNPVVLDANGRAPIFGAGRYRQQVKASNGTVLFDAETSLGEGDLPLATELAALTFDDQVQVLRTGGFANHGKGAANYVRLASAPSITEQQAGLNRWLFRSNANAIWWRLAEPEPTDLMFGAEANATVSASAGVMTVSGPDDTAAIQAAFDYLCYFTTLGHRLRLPAGVRRITNTLHLGYGDRYVDWQIDGDAMFGYSEQLGYQFGIFADFNDRPAINIQAARMARIGGLALFGLNHAWLAANEDLIADRAPRSAWHGAQLRADTVDTRFSPYCGIAVDAYAGPRQTSSSYPDVPYSAWTQITTQYDKGFSSNVEFRDIFCGGFEVGLVVQPNMMPSASNGDFMHFTSCDLASNLVGTAISHADARVICFDRSKFHGCHTAFDSVSYGAGNGNIAASFLNCSFDRVYRVLNVDLGIATQPFAPALIFTNAYGEAMYSLGSVRKAGAAGRPGAIRFIGGEFGFRLNSAEFSPTSYLDGRGEVLARFEDVSIHGTHGLFPVNCNLAMFAGTFPAVSFGVFDQSTLGGQRAANALGGVDAPQTGQISVRPHTTYGIDGAASFTLRQESHGFDHTGAGSMPSGQHIPLFVRSINHMGCHIPIAAAPKETLNRATVPLAGITQNGTEWSFSVAGSFLSDPDNPAACLGAGDVVRDETSGVIFYIKAVSFSGAGATLSVTMTLRQLTSVRTNDGIAWTTAATLGASTGVLTFRCARRVLAGASRRLAMTTTVGSGAITLAAIGPETFAASDLGNPVRTIAVGDYLIPVDRGAATIEDAVFAKGRIVAIATSGGAPTGAITLDSNARRSGIWPAPLFIKAM